MYHNITHTPGQISRGKHDTNTPLHIAATRASAPVRFGANPGIQPPLPPDDASAREAEGLVQVRYTTPTVKTPLQPDAYLDRESAPGAQVTVEPQTPGANPYGTIALDQGLSFADVQRTPIQQKPGHQAVLSSFNVGGAADLTDVHPFIA